MRVLVGLLLAALTTAPLGAFPASPAAVQQAHSEGNEDRAAVVISFSGTPRVELRSRPQSRWVLLEFANARLAAGAQVLPAWPGLVEAASLEQTSDRSLRVAVQVARATRVSVYRSPGDLETYTVLVQHDDDGALLPVKGRLSSNFGWRLHPILHEVRMHQGIDIAVPNGTPIRAVLAGDVTWAGERGGAGLCVILRHPDGVESKYMHCSEILVHVGDHIHRRQPLARSGETGLTTGPHVHFAITKDGESVDPVRYLRHAEALMDAISRPASPGPR